MKKNKKLFIITVLCIVLCSGCSSMSKTPETQETPEPVEKIIGADITIPSVLVGDELSQAGVEIEATDNGDGTVTFSLNGEELTNVLNQIADNIADSIETILEDDDYYPNITAITANDNYTSFTISLKDGQMTPYESMLVMSFYTVGNQYQIYNGVPAEEAVTTVTYINDTDGTVIGESDSTSMDTFSSP